MNWIYHFLLGKPLKEKNTPETREEKGKYTLDFFPNVPIATKYIGFIEKEIKILEFNHGY